MRELDSWAVAMGETACRFLSRNDHDTVYQMLCSDGASAAGWKLFAGAVAFVIVSYGLWRLFRPA